MNRLSPTSLHYYDMSVTELMMQKYGYSRMDAVRKFVSSKTHEMLEDNAYGLYAFGCHGIFDMWEAEMVTGDPRNSIYIRGE